jgi:DNA-binding GntR family transcriptional regulator
MASRVEEREAPARASVALPPRSPRSQSEEAYLKIRDRIVSLEMPPGSVVNEARLQHDLNIGRTPIREALQRLAHEKLVHSVPHRGTFVTDVKITDLARITEVRVVIEGHAARLAAERCTTGDQAILAELLASLKSRRVMDQRELMRMDQQIHRQIYQAARNSFLESTLERYFNLSLRLWFLVLDHEVRLRAAVEEHVELLEAVIAHDGDAAEAIMRRHVTGFEHEIRKALVGGLDANA